jgi:hypothetical protein
MMAPVSPFPIRPVAGPEVPSLREERNARRERFLRSTDSGARFALALELSRDCEALGQTEKAAVWNRHAKEEAARLGTSERAFAAAQHGGLALRTSRLSDAEAAYREALRQVQAAERPDERLTCELREALGYTLVCRGKWQDGTRELFTALTSLEAMGERSRSARALLHLCYAFLRAGRAADARWFGEEAMSRLAECHGTEGGEPDAADRRLEKELLYLLGEACERVGDADGAAAYRARLSSHYPDFRNLRAYLEVLDLAPVLNLV